MKIAIIGAGLSGLSLARALRGDFEIELFEKEAQIGGIARTRDVQGRAYHINGGHIFDSKYEDVKAFVFDEILPLTEWMDRTKRDARVFFKGQLIPYPIEFSVKEIDAFDTNLAFAITKEMFEASYDKNVPNLEQWFINHFGKTLSEAYFIPYNTKIWGIAPSKMSSAWIEDERQMKLPVPTKRAFYEALLGRKSDNMSHRSFYYPKSKNQNTFIDAFAKGLKINFEPIKSIEAKTGGVLLSMVA
ncbi:protoporphyrinogen/coproporphyrinogen oxidase [Campylobacter troglodytis]|uniref:protoporphyrinogen/coproporphyrinogen oxidase n=1 Tax=Campylobacter troglodytis TaxID=654363 RepID=UPI001FE6009F|nr:NAD(P)-binding protein [Campylobacter troglodytis]